MSIETTTAAVEVGQEAPDFTLVDDTGEQWTLSQHRGKNVVLVFYPLSFSGTCTKELHALTGDAERFAGAGAEVVGISVDSRHVQRRFKSDEELKVTLLADFQPRGAVASQYGMFLPDFGFANRGTFVIDKTGKVAFKVVGPLGEVRDPEAYLEALRNCPV